MSESFYLSIIGVGSACLTRICFAGCKYAYRIKCVDFSCLGLICTRDIEKKNEADLADVIPPSTRNSISSPPISRRNSLL